MGDLTTASSTDSSSDDASAGAAGSVAGVCGCSDGSGALAGAIAGGMGNAAEAFRIRSFIPPLSTSNSARSCCRTSSRMRSMSSNSIIPQNKVRPPEGGRYGLGVSTGLCATGLCALLQVYRHIGEDFTPVLCNQHIVLDPDTADAVHVRARLDREHHPGHHRLIRKCPRELRNAWILMHLESQPVPCAVSERLAQSVPDEHVPRGPVDLARHYPGPNCRNRRRVGLPDGPSQTKQLQHRRAKVQRPRKIYAVSVVDAPEVQHHPLARREPSGPRTGVWTGAIRTRCDDRLERGTLEPGRADCRVDGCGHLQLGSSFGDE